MLRYYFKSATCFIFPRETHVCFNSISWDASSTLGHPYQEEEEEEEEEEECRLFASAIQNPISRFDVQVRDSTVCVFDFFKNNFRKASWYEHKDRPYF